MKYTEIPITDVQLNLSKNQLQPAYWKDVNAYAFDNMLQPVSKTDVKYKNNFVIEDSLYSIDNKSIYKNGILLHSYDDEYLSNTTEYAGYKKGNYRLGTDNNFYYNSTAVLSVDYEGSALWVHNSKDAAILLCTSGLYYFEGITFTRYDIPEFDFDECVQVDDTDNICLFENKSHITDSLPVVNKLTSGTVTEFRLLSTYPMITIKAATGSTGGGAVLSVASSLTDSTSPIKYYITKSNDASKFRVVPYGWGRVVQGGATVSSSYTIPGEAQGIVSLNRYAEYDINSNITYVTKDVKEPVISQADTSTIVATSKPITVNSVGYKNYNNGLFGFEVIFNTYRVTAAAYTTTTAFVYSDTNTYDNSTTSSMVDSLTPVVISVKNAASKYTKGDYTIIYESGVIKYILYKSKLIAIPYIVDDYYITDDSIIIYSSTVKKSYAINFSTTNNLIVTKIGNELVTNSLTNAQITVNGIKDNDFSTVILDAKYSGFATTLTTLALLGSIGNGYIGYSHNDTWEGANELYTSTTVTKKNITSLYDFTGAADVYLGTTGVVDYAFSVNDSMSYKKNKTKEYGVSEEACYVIPSTDNIKVLLDYDIYNAYVKIQGYVIQLSVTDNEIQPAITLASIDSDTDYIFTLQGQGYQIIKDKIYSFTSGGESGLTNQQFVTPCSFEYIGYDDTAAYFWDKLTHNIISFQGNNQMTIIQSMSLLDDIVFTAYNVEHQMLVISTSNKTYIKLYNSWMSFDFATDTSAVVYKDKLLLDNNQLILGKGKLDVQTGWIYNNVANQPLINIDNIFITLLEAGDVEITVEFMSPDKTISTMTKEYSNIEYIKITPTSLLCKAIRLHIKSNTAITNIALSVDDKTKDSPISNRQYIEL